MIWRAFLVSLVICFLSLTSLPVFSLTPTPMNVAGLSGSLSKIIVRVTVDGTTKFWWYKAEVRYFDGSVTRYCGKYDLSLVMDQPITTDDITMFEYLMAQNEIASSTMSDTDKAWCLQ